MVGCFALSGSTAREEQSETEVQSRETLLHDQIPLEKVRQALHGQEVQRNTRVYLVLPDVTDAV